MTFGPTDRAVKLRHSLTPEDVEAIVDALEVDELAIVTLWGRTHVDIERITAALCGGCEEDYR